MQWYTLAPEIHKGAILPIGDEPSGRSWTGFQSIDDDKHGYLIVYRELTPDASGLLKTWLPAGAKIKCKALMAGSKSTSVSRTPLQCMNTVYSFTERRQNNA